MTHEQMYRDLINRMKLYHPSSDFTIINDVYEFAVEAHGSQTRQSGEPYMIHPMQAAIILSDIRSDMETIAAGILHDVVEDTDYSYEDINARFGPEIADLVKGVTKLQTLKYVSKEEEQAENYRQLFFVKLLTGRNQPRLKENIQGCHNQEAYTAKQDNVDKQKKE